MKKMRKTISIALLLVMSVAFIAACGDNGDTEAPQAPPPPAGNGDAAPVTAVGPEVGTLAEDVDHHGRRTYTIVYAHFQDSILQQQMYEAYRNLESRFNFELIRMSGQEDTEMFVTNLEVLLDRGDIDGFIIETTNAEQHPVLMRMNASGIPFINQFTEYFDADGRVITPTVGLPQHYVGHAAMTYLIDNRQTFWGDVDSDNFGVIGICFSVSPALYDRTQGFLDAFRDAFPGNENVFYIDTFAGGPAHWFSLEGGYEPTVQTIAANPHVTHWFVGGTVESYSAGAARAAETLGRDDTMLVTTVGHPLIVDEWEAGYDGAKRAVMAISNYAYATPVILGLIALIDGRATPETLWPQHRADGDLAAVWPATFGIITRENYASFLEEMETRYGP